MKILLSDITDEGLDIILEETFNSGPLKFLTPVKAMLRLEKIGSEVIIKGDVRAGVELQCGRCLANFPKEMETHIDVVYRPVEELKGEERHEIKEDELDTGFYRGEELNVQELAIEQLLLDAPMKPLCSESCKGICPKCGADLNVNPCKCEIREPDMRLSILKKLIDNRKE